jgi:hypothetical protein
MVGELADGVEEAEWRPMGLVVRPRHCVFLVLHTHKVAAKIQLHIGAELSELRLDITLEHK